MKYSNKPRHYAPHKRRRWSWSKNTPQHRSLGGKKIFDGEGGLMQYILGLFGVKRDGNA